MNLQLAHDVGAVIIYRLVTDTKSLRYFPVGCTASDLTYYLSFARREHAWLFSAFKKFQNFRRNNLATIQNDRDRITHPAWVGPLHEQTVDSGCNEIAQQTDRCHACENDHLCMWAPASHLSIDFDALGQRHGNIQRQQCRLQLSNKANSAQAILCLTHNLNSLDLLKDVANTSSQHGVVIGNHCGAGI